MVAPLDPYIIRIGQTTSAPVTWNNTTQLPMFTYGPFAKLYNLTRALGAKVYLSLPAGTWGDGNWLPAGMPLDPNQTVTWGNSTGYFPTAASYEVYLRGLLQGLSTQGWAVDYWNIGNEVPVKNGPNVTVPYVALFNEAATLIHQYEPDALVGSDVFTVSSQIAYISTGSLLRAEVFLDLYLADATTGKRLKRLTDEKGLTLVPLKFYLKRGYVKCELGIAKGKKLFDKRDDIRKRDQKRELEREFRVK